jgi:uncharacterized protein (DUF2236 family)
MRVPGVLPRDHWVRRIEAMDPCTDYEAISRITGHHEFPWDVQQALSFALFRTYAVPSIGSLLHATSEFTGSTQKRHDDTVVILETVLDDGMENPDGRTAIRRMNQMHGSYDIPNEDMLYVLCTFVVAPVRWIDELGWRPLTETEKVAAVQYYRRLGRLMGIRGMPEDLAGFERHMDEYEARHFAYDPGSRAVADATLDLFVSFYPRRLQGLMRRFAIALLDDHLRRAFDYPAPSRGFQRMAREALKARSRVVRMMPPRRRPYDPRRSHRIRSYPGGFMVERLGTFPGADAPRATPREAASA